MRGGGGGGGGEREGGGGGGGGGGAGQKSGQWALRLLKGYILTELRGS